MYAVNAQPPSPTESIGPPSYEISVAEKPRARRRAPAPSSILDEDGFLVYDPDVFETVANSYAGHGRPSSLHPLSPAKPTSSPRLARPHLYSVTPLDSGDLDDLPPPFSPAGTSSGTIAYGRPPRIDLMHSASRPNSPLSSPPADRPDFVLAPSPRPTTPPAHPSLSPRHPSPQLPGQRRKASAYMLPLDFDPHVAYTDARDDTHQASALYNPMVAAHLPGARHSSQLRPDSATLSPVPSVLAIAFLVSHE
ncbi:hypothetical protein K488DRAFT_89708 [Vararia minispora EC-137]|uniref:Uncharacterized protein n=1 Tax=Vararia minispora EC-137 TaxID=1314806 RepID=A0ACB8Q9T3_9AGAM|nr:hypothetical protein K488DRAFT_89708 [Vararia minispora EC-137]